MIGSYLLKIEKDFELKNCIRHEYIFREYDDDFCNSMYDYLVSEKFLINKPGEEIDQDVINKVLEDSHKSPLIVGNLNQAATVKPGNIVLNWKKLIFEAPTVVEAGVALETHNWVLIGCAALSLWKSIKKIWVIPITKEQSIVLLGLWNGYKSVRSIPVIDGLSTVNEFCRNHGEQPLEEREYQKALDDLLKLKCIDLQDDTIFLKEKARQKYN